MASKRILFTSVCRPLGEGAGDGPSVGYELLHGQVTRAQGLFSPRALHLHFALEYIAENIEAPAVVLQYPSQRELIAELKKGYDYVGVSFLLAVFHKMKDVVALIREHAPEAKIILGGYGTVLSDEALKPYGDYICREEGVAFIRRLLGEPELAMPYRHPLVVSQLKVFSLPVSRTGMIFAGLGCPNGCDFCCTSYFFKRRHVKLLPTGKDIYAVIERYLERDPGMVFAVLDEDFLLDKKRAMELRECVIQGGKQVSMFVFSSIRAISQYKVEEILEMGIDGFWIGYEGTRSGFGKQRGRPAGEIFKEFREHGIIILASMIVGFPYQTPEIVEEELSGLMAARPVLSQFLIYGPTPGTPFYERIMEEGLLHKELEDDREKYYRNCTGFTAMVRHPNLKPDEIEELQAYCYQQDFERLGPSIYRYLENYYQGCQTLRHSPNPILRNKAQWYERELKKAYPIFLAGKWLAPNSKIAKWIAGLERNVYNAFGKPTLSDRLRSAMVLALAIWTRLKLRLDLFQHPRGVRHAFRMPEESQRLHRAWRQLTRLNLPISIESRPENLVWIRFEQWLNRDEAGRFLANLETALKRKKDHLVLDLARLRRLEDETANALFVELRKFRDRIRLIIPPGLDAACLPKWVYEFNLYH